MIEFLKKIFSYRIEFNFLLNPLMGIHITALKDYQGVTDVKREIPIIVSLSSTRENYKELPITIYSLLNQTLKPDRIILWLDEDYEDLTYLPYEISQFIKNGLEIKFVKNKGLYTQTYYPLKNFSDSIIVTANDSIYYQKNWLKNLYLSYIAHSSDIQVDKALMVDLNKSFKKWNFIRVKNCASFLHFPIGKYGVLYPPNCFKKEVLREDVYSKKIKDNCDLWYWVMALVHDKKIRVVENSTKLIISTNLIKSFCRNKVSIDFDSQLKLLISLYGQKILNKL